MGARSLINPSENENPEEREARLALGTGQMHAAEPRGRLRNRQRRVKEWRTIMAKELVCAGTAETLAGPNGLPELALVGTDPRS